MKPFIAILFASAILKIQDATAAVQTEAASSATRPSLTAAGASFAPQFSSDGRYIVFASYAKNLTTNNDSSSDLNLFRRDLLSGETVLISVATNRVAGGDGNSAAGSVSSNGQFVAFASSAGNLVSSDTNASADIFSRDLINRSTGLATVDLLGTGAPPNSNPGSSRPLSSAPEISQDGRWVVFESCSTNLVAVPNDKISPAVFARDLLSNSTVLVSVNTNGTFSPNSVARLPHASGGGRFVTFVSSATDLIPEGTPLSENLFRRDLDQNITVCLSKDLPGYLGSFTNNYPANYRFVDHAVSQDGKVVAYKITHPSTSLVWVFRYDAESDSTVMVTSNSYYRTTPRLSGDGRLLAYEDGTNVLVWDHLLQSNIVVNLDLSGLHPASGISHSPSLSTDGRFVAFLSNTGDLTTNASNSQFQVFSRDLLTGTTRLDSFNTNGEAASANHELNAPVISADGSRIAFESTAADIVENDLNLASDVFVFNSSDNSVSLVSKADIGRRAMTGAGASGNTRNALSADGRVIAFFGYDNQTNLVSDIFIRDVISGTNRIITLVTNGLFNPEISSDGRYLTYNRRRLRGSSALLHDDVLRYDLFSGSFTFVSDVTSFNGTGNGGTAHSMSRDGRMVAYQSSQLDENSKDQNFVDDIYLRDFISNSNTLVSVQLDGFAGGGESPLFANDGEKLFFFRSTSPTRQLYLKLISQNTAPRLVSHIPTGTDPLPGYVTSVAVSGNSGNAIFGIRTTNSDPTSEALYRYLPGSDNVSFICTPCQNGSLDDTGALLAYEVPGFDSNRSVYLRDLETGQTNLLSRAADLGFPSDAPIDAWAPVISSDARFILFLGRLDTSKSNATRLYLRDRALNQTLLLTPNPEGMGLLTGDGAQLNISRDSRTALFRSFAGDIVAGDFNDSRDVFVVRLGSGDSDGDGMDDDWEMAYFNTLSRNGSGDFDNDGQSDLQEFRAGTDPTNQGSLLRALSVSRIGGGTTVLWSAVSGRSYRVEFKDNVDDPGWTTVSGQVQTSGSTGWIDDPSAASSSHRFYRIRVIR